MLPNFIKKAGNTARKVTIVRNNRFEPMGYVDFIDNHRVAGWVWNKRIPTDRLDVIVRHGEVELAEVKACAYRPDLEKVGIGDGHYSFDVRLAQPLPNEALSALSVEVKVSGQIIPILSTAIQVALRDCQLNVYNIKKLYTQPPSTFGIIRFDPNNDCNLRCVYCHNHRSKDVIDVEEFRAFIHHNVIGARDFQVGCIMEPTLDSRLTDFMLMVAASPAKPEAAFMLQTNGILLHRHDYKKMKDAGLNQLQVSLDTADPGTQRSLRSGMSLQKVLRNIAGFRQTCPEIDVTLVATVTSENVENMENLVALGLDVGAQKFVFREVFYHRDNDVVDHERMPRLLLKHGDFAAMTEKILGRFGDNRASFVFANEEFLEDSTQKMLSDSARR
jgi:sulfatase maturation enzyme AslB (radical SAM superfamily)